MTKHADKLQHPENGSVCRVHAATKKLFGPPDKKVYFSDNHANAESYKIGQRVEVRYDDNIWYKGTLVEFINSPNEWITQFDIDEAKTIIKFPDEDVRVL